MEFSNNETHFCFVCAVTEIFSAMFQRQYVRGEVNFFKNETFIIPTRAKTTDNFDVQEKSNKCGHNVQYYYHFRY